jgi:type VI secretion system protein ImpA
MPINTELLQSLLAPVSADAPSGKSLRDDPRYDVAEEARREDLDLPTGGLATERKVADWPKAVTLLTQLLKESKDLQLAAWLVEALYRRQGFNGLATGLELLRGLLEQQWETVLPFVDTKDPDVDPDDFQLRSAPLQWVGSKLNLPVWEASVTTSGLTYLAYQASRAIPTEAEAEDNREKRARRAEAIDEGKLPPEEVDAAVASRP